MAIPAWVILVVILMVIASLCFLGVVNVREWLLYAVTDAEQQFGGGTGAVKLRYVYDWLLARWGWFGRLLPFTLFSKMVDAVLVKMRRLLEANTALRDLVEGGADER